MSQLKFRHEWGTPDMILPFSSEESPFSAVSGKQ
jgi:hypothetical protein